MTEIEAQRLTYISKDGLVCYKDHKSPNVISAYDIKATHSLDEACTIIDILLRRLADAVRAKMRYEAICTIEEFKALKLGKLGNKGFITIGQTMEEYAQEIRAKAIDEFVEKLNTDVESFEAEVNGIRADLLTLDYFSEFVFDVAEQMKGEQNG